MTDSRLSASSRIALAAYLHDLVTLPKDHPDRADASRRAAKASAPILRDLGLSRIRLIAGRDQRIKKKQPRL